MPQINCFRCDSCGEIFQDLSPAMQDMKSKETYCEDCYEMSKKNAKRLEEKKQKKVNAES